MEYALALLILTAAVAVVVARPLRGRPTDVEDERRVELEAAKESKYREIRDAELDYRSGKMSEEDYRRTDAELRAQAIEILRELDETGVEEGGNGR